MSSNSEPDILFPLKQVLDLSSSHHFCTKFQLTGLRKANSNYMSVLPPNCCHCTRSDLLQSNPHTPPVSALSPTHICPRDWLRTCGANHQAITLQSYYHGISFHCCLHGTLILHLAVLIVLMPCYFFFLEERIFIPNKLKSLKYDFNWFERQLVLGEWSDCEPWMKMFACLFVSN